MIYDIKDALLIAGGLIFCILWFVDYVIKKEYSDDECPHCFADFQSTGTRKCIDCNLEEPITKHYPKHQR